MYIWYIQAPALTLVGLSQANLQMWVFWFFSDGTVPCWHCPDCGCARNLIPASSEGCWRSINQTGLFGVSSSVVSYCVLVGGKVCILWGRRKSILCYLGLIVVNWGSLVFLGGHLLCLFLSWMRQNGSVFEILPSSNEQRTRTLLPLDI